MGRSSFFFQAEDGIRDADVTGVQTCALPISRDAEERTQDVFVRLWDKLRSFRGESAFSSWLHRLAVNVVLNERRTTGRRERRVMTAEDPDAVVVAQHAAALAAFAVLTIDLEPSSAALPDGATQ